MTIFAKSYSTVIRKNDPGSRSQKVSRSLKSLKQTGPWTSNHSTKFRRFDE